MGFDIIWFNKLRKLDSNIIRQVPPDTGRFYPNTADLWHEDHAVLNVFTNRFFEELDLLTYQLRKNNIRFYRFFQIPGERHVANFPEHTCCRCQWNIAFTAGATRDHDMARVGIGFRLNDLLVSNSYQSYQDYLEKIRSNPIGFNNLFMSPLDYSEPNRLFLMPNKANAILNYGPLNPLDDWIFFGRAFRSSIPADQQTLQNTNGFARAALSIFSQIRAAGFSC